MFVDGPCWEHLTASATAQGLLQRRTSKLAIYLGKKLLACLRVCGFSGWTMLGTISMESGSFGVATNVDVLKLQSIAVKSSWPFVCVCVEFGDGPCWGQLTWRAAFQGQQQT